MFNSSSNGGYSLADIAAATGSNRNDGFDFGSGNGGFFLLFFIFLIILGWGGNGFGGYGNGGGAPLVNAVNNDVQRGFDQSAIISGLNAINTGMNAGFSSAEISRCNSQANILQTMNNNQAATSSQINSLGSVLQQCCCNQQANTADLKYTIATENCADRAALADALKDVIASNTANTQVILDKLCQQEIDALKAQNQQLQMQNYLASLAASQNAQTGQILTDNAAQTTALLRALNPAPIPAYIVSNPNGCNCGTSCGI